MGQPRMILRWKLLDDFTLFRHGVGQGLLSMSMFLPMMAIAAPAASSLRHTPLLEVAILSVLLIYVVLVAIVTWRAQWQCVGAARSAICGAGFGLGYVSIAIVPAFAGCIVAHLSTIFVSLFALAVAGPIIGSLFFQIAGWLHRRLAHYVVQDGTCCPGCAYNLIGNQSMVCPECGRPFTFEELGTTEAAFRQLAARAAA